MFTFAYDFEKAARQAAETMTGNVADLPDCGGMKLVRLGTPEFEERSRDAGVLIIPITVNGIPYHICSR